VANRTSSIQREVLLDAIAGTAAITSVPATLVNDGASFQFEGTAADAGSGVEEVQIAFANDGTGSQLAAGTTNWSAIVDLSMALGSEGDKTLYVRVEDRAGNLSDWTAVQQGFIYDTANPVTILDGTDNRDVKAGFSISGTASDNYGIASIEITQSKDGGADIPVTVNGPAGTTTWSLTDLPRIPGNIGTQDVSDGTYVYKIISTDSAGKTSIETVSTVTLDLTAPEILTVTNPGATQTGLNSLSGGAYTFRGTSSDSGVGMSKIYYRIDQNSSASIEITDYDDLTTSGNWSFTDDFDTDSGGADTGRAEGTWYIHVLAEDTAENRTDFGSAVTVEFDIDQALPALTETVSGIAGSATVYRNADIDLGGTATDGNGVGSVSINYSKNGAAPIALPVTFDADGIDNIEGNADDDDWSASLPGNADHSDDGNYELEIIAVDGVGKTTSMTRNIGIDTLPPDLIVLNPVDSELIDSSSYMLRGQISDNGGVGVTELEYSRDNSSWTAITMTGLNWSAPGIDFSAPVGAENAQGSRILYVRATDGLNPEVVNTISFNYDTENPVLTETDSTLSDVQHISSSAVTFGGTASDTNALLFGDHDSDGGAVTPETEYIELSINGTPGNIIVSGGTWTHTLPNSADGIFALEFTATDASGRTTTIERNILIDDTAPAAPVISSTPGNYVTSSLSLTGTAVDGTSGIASVEYSIDGESSWHALSGTDNWFGVVDISLETVGSKTVHVRTTDRAGKISASTSQAYIIDRDNPALVINGFTGTVFETINFTIDGTMDDRDLGVTPISISVELDGVPVDLTGYPLNQNVVAGTWSQEIPVTNGDNGSCEIIVTATDAVGRTVNDTRTVGIDTAVPVLTIDTDFTGWFDSNTIQVTGTAADTGSQIKVIQYSFDETNWIDLSSGTTWSGYISVPGGDNNPLYLRAADSVDLYSLTESLIVKVDTSAPVISMVNPTALVKINGASDLAIDILAQDIAQSGVLSARVKVGSIDFTTPDFERILTAGTAEFNNTWNLTLPAAAVPVAEGQISVNVEFKDVAGNTTIQSFPILVDRTAPTGLAISSHADDDTVNKTITVFGSASDSQGLDSVLVEIYNDNSTLWEPLSTSGLYSWTTDVNTVTYDDSNYDTNAAAGTQIQIRMTAADAAGNTASLTRDLNIDQNSDRPIVSINNLDTTGNDTLKLSRTIYGSLADDDGITSFEISEDNSIWSTITLSGSSWQYDVSAANGTKNLYFRVVDTEGLSFATNEADEPRVIGDAAGEIADTLTFKLDTITPEIYSIITADRLSPFTFTADANTQTVTTNMPFGGTSSLFALKVLARDANTIGTVSINIPGLGNVATTKGTDELGYEVYTTNGLNISALSDGSVDMVITVTDASGLSSTASRTILLDNTAPDISYLSPRDSLDVVNGDIPVRGLASDSGSALETVEYRVGYNYADEVWQPVGGSLFNWELDFSGVNKTDNFAGLEVDDVNTNGTITLAGHGYTDDTAVWVGAASLPTGLSSAATYYIVNSTADTFELAASAGGAGLTYAAIGSEVRISKYSKDSNADSIWELPILVRATDYAGNSTAVSDSTYIILVDPSGDKPHPVIVYPDPANSNRVMGGIIRIFGTAADDDGVDSVYMQIDVDNDGDYDAADIDSDLVDWYNGGEGIAVTGAASWNMNINENGEFNPGSGTNPINFRVRVKDIYGTFGPWSESQHIEVDNSVPKIGSSEAPALTQGATSQAYISDMYIKGDWILEGTIEDESDISDIQVTGSITGSLSGNPSWFEDYSGTGTNGYRMKIPVTTSGTGLYVFTVTATDGSTPQTNNSATFRINYDNEAPTLSAYEGQTPVEQSNKTYHLTSTVNEDGSGLERVAFFFLRQGATNAEDRLYNPMEEKALDANRTYLNHAYTNGSTIAFIDGLPRIQLSSAVRSDEYTLQHDDLIANTNVRKGGLIKIGGLDRLITAVDYPTGTLSWSGAVAVGVTDASAAYALVVDHDIPETPVWNPDNTLASITNDDGDGLIEELSRTGTEYVWNAFIDSKEIPDGPIEIHWIAFDKSGNYTADFETTEVLNHRPMMASVLLGTDLDGSNVVEADEKVPAYSLLDGSGFNQAVATSASGSGDASPFTAKGETTVEIEIIGGNGQLQYEFFEGAGVTNIHGSLQNLRTDEISAVDPITVTIADFTSGEIGEGDRNLVFKIWDNTEETTAGVDSQWAELTIPMTVDVVDDIIPMAVISPFFWTDETDNSLYSNSRDNGHIEITGVADGTDPDISGQIRVRGTAYDNQRIDELYIRIDDMTISTGSSASFNTENYALVSEYTSGSWSSTGDFAVDGWYFSATDISIDQSGHRVEWQLDWDTKELSTVTGLNKDIKIVSVDKGSNNSAFTAAGSDIDDKTFNEPVYGVDVVPYITEITTALSAKSLLIPSVTNRYSTGEYPVRLNTGNTNAETETITIKGFNFPDDVSDSVTIDTTPMTYTVVGETLTVSLDGLAESGDLKVTTNSVDSINNLTDNGLNSNQEPNDRNNNVLTDDRNIIAWDFTSYDPGVADIRMVDMETSGDTVNFSLGYSSQFHGVIENVTTASGSGADLVRQSYNRYFDNRFDYNTDGQYFAVAQCGDIYEPPAAGNNGDFNQTSTFSLSLDNIAAGVTTEYFNNGDRFLKIENNWNGDELINFERVQNPDLAVSGNNATSNIYLSYYDTTQNLLKFRFFQVGTGVTGFNFYGAYNSTLYPYRPNGTVDSNRTMSAIPEDATSNYQGYVAIAGISDGSKYNAVAYDGGTAIVTWYDAAAGALKMAYNTNPGTSYSGYQEFDTYSATNNADYTANLTVDDTVYTGISFNAGANKYGFAYNLNSAINEYGAFAEINPKTGDVVVRSFTTGTSSNVTITNIGLSNPTAADGGGNAWVYRTLDDDFAGKHVALEVDPNGGVHIAYENTSYGDLKYIYLPSVSGTAEKVTVDSYLQSGQFIDLTLREQTIGLDGGSGAVTDYVPLISYYSISFADSWSAVKFATPVFDLTTPTAGLDGLEDVIADGADTLTELFTGNWRVGHLPSLGPVLQFRTNINTLETDDQIVIAYEVENKIEYVKLVE